MAGIDDNVALTGDWGLPSPSPRTFFSRMLDEDNVTRSISEHSGNGRTGDLFLGIRDPSETGKGNMKDGAQDGDSRAQLSEQKSSSRGGLVERMAARAGFNAPRLNTESIRSTDLSLNSDIQSPYLTIPPGLSPTTLLDSPVFLANSLAQPSPTTGKFLFMSNSNMRNSELPSDALEKCKDNGFDMYTSSFAFKPATDSGSSFYHGAGRKINPTTIPQQSLPGIEVSAQSENSFQSQSVDAVKVQTENKSGLHLQADFGESPPQNDNGSKMFSADQMAFDAAGGSTEHSTPIEEQADEEGDQRVNGDSMSGGVGGAPSDDGYNWRKYGQKQVKGSEYPRSYYKCTHPNCQVKKKVERSHEGHITEIIYKGAHNHPKPPPNRRSGIGSVNLQTDMQVDNPEHVEPQNGGDGDLGWTNVQKGNIAGAANWKQDNLEATSSASVGPEYCNQSTNLQTQNGTNIDSGEAVDASSTFSNEEDEDDQGTHGSVSLGYDGEGDESESKRRKLESYAELSGATRAIREPRVVVQTTSEVDILDDGYRWRKYGQKVVKGNPNPRSYYKCTNAGCTVRKHVERASHDLKSVITTYEGKHNHDVPAARASSHVNANASNAVSGQASGVLQNHVHRPEPSQVHNGIGRLERPSLGSFNLPGRQQLGPSHGFSFGMNQTMLSNFAMSGLGHAQAKLPIMPVHPFLAQQQQQQQHQHQHRSANDLGFMMPKGEPNMETIPERGLNLSSGSSVYQEIMSRMPLGPHM
ncbi:probable WRKY transcription factor 2 [Cajanus cajan]|uniref:probable WRKY transcription factor 2 n=1 Tax=Cajanus cajan TaxID=3821 RepID=UPI00098D7E82|nr:probable WRKY transcription factor 2 [Cajanus cajan]XP_020223536.1 probable WRKY transcription factor 2 [Cajanus cajan]